MLTGHWPTGAYPDGRENVLVTPLLGLLYAVGALPVVVCGVLAVAAVGRWNSREYPFLAILAIVVVSCTIFVIFALVDPGDFIDWVLD
jgi:hypothetical protein